MSREYSIPDFHPYMHLHVMQTPPPPPPPHQYSSYMPLSQPLTNPNAAAYEMRAAQAPSGGAGAPASSAHALSPSHHHLEPRKRKTSHYSEGYERGARSATARFDTDRGTAGDAHESGSDRSEASASRHRKSSSYGSGSGGSSVFDDDGGDESRSSRGTSCSTQPDKKQNHSEIEKRRRDKMNMYITELSSMIPMCGAMARKLDKLTALRMAVAHLRGVRGSLAGAGGAAAERPPPALFHATDLNALILHAAAAADCFLLVVGCDRGRLLYLSHSVQALLNYDQSELVGQSMFDILHPKDVAKVKEQLSSSDLSPRDRFIDAKTMLPLRAEVSTSASRLCPGARRSFLCRVKCKPSAPAPASAPKDEPDAAAAAANQPRKYRVLHCTGYLKSWAPAEMESGCEVDEDPAAVSCLVAVARALPPAPAPAPPPAPAPARPLSYVSRHAIDGKFLFVDQRVTLALGFLPQELLGTSLYEYVGGGGGAVGGVARAHKQALLRCEPHCTPPYAVRTKDHATTTIQTHFKPFRNPWTKEFECLVANNCVVSEPPPAPAPPDAHRYEPCTQPEEWRSYLREGAEGAAADGDADVQRLIESQVESHKIGNAIADEALRRAPASAAAPSLPSYSPLPADLMQDPIFNPLSMVDNILGTEAAGAGSVRNNVPLSAARAPSPPGGGVGGGGPLLATDGNGEAAMAVIMSLLEADAGLGGPVNFASLPWPLP